MTEDNVPGTPVAYNPFQPGFAENPYQYFGELREHEPVHLTPMGFWMLFRYDDVLSFLRDPSLSVDDRLAHPTMVSAIVEEVMGPESNRRSYAMLNRDPPDHTRLRRLVSKVFLPRTVQQMEPRIQELVDEVLDLAEERGGIELMGDLAFPLPFAVISELLGMPDVDPDELLNLSRVLVGVLEPVGDPEALRAIAKAGEDMRNLIREAIDERRRRPDDRLLSALITAEEDGDMLSDEELADQVELLYIAGHETTVNLIGNGTWALLRHPAQLELLRRDPVLITDAVEELARFDCPVQMTRRITLAPVDVGGRTLEEGATVALVLGSANHDPAHFGPTADSLDLHRSDAHTHVSFGGGHHYCLGATLARLEARLTIGTLFRRFPSIDVGAEPTWNGHIILRGLDQLQLSFRS